MPTKGLRIINPHTGDSNEFLETSKDSNGERVILKSIVKHKGPLVKNHIHVLQDETLEVFSGQLTVFYEGQTIKLSAGEKIKILKNTPHNHYNTEDEPVTFTYTFEPALDIDYFIEGMIRLSCEGKRNKNGGFGIVQDLVGLKYVDSKTFLADIPIGVQKLLMNIVGPIGRLFGYRAIYKKYSGIEK